MPCSSWLACKVSYTPAESSSQTDTTCSAGRRPSIIQSVVCHIIASHRASYSHEVVLLWLACNWQFGDCVVIESLNRLIEKVAAAFKPKQHNGRRKCAENSHESAKVMLYWRLRSGGDDNLTSIVQNLSCQRRNNDKKEGASAGGGGKAGMVRTSNQSEAVESLLSNHIHYNHMIVQKSLLMRSDLSHQSKDVWLNNCRLHDKAVIWHLRCWRPKVNCLFDVIAPQSNSHDTMRAYAFDWTSYPPLFVYQIF